MPKVSVIIPCYNHASYLKRRVDSILGQTYQDFEVILLDDCSNDGSAEILRSYEGNPKVSHVVINESNSGSTFMQWEKGFSLAKGEYIWIAESDDWCEKTLLETLVQALDNDPQVMLSFCQCQLIDENGNKLYKTSLGDGKLSGEDFVRRYMFGDMIIVNAGMALFRRSAIEGIDMTYKTMRAAGDWRFWIEIALKGKVAISGQTLAYCFRHSGTVTSKSVMSGNDIAEGNANFNHVRSKLNPTDKELSTALKQRIRIYMEQRKLYSSANVRKQCKRQVLDLDSKAKLLYFRIKLKRLFT